jgi:Flp pilus assembly pilin Flp
MKSIFKRNCARVGLGFLNAETWLWDTFVRGRNAESGQGLVEYCLIITVIALAVFAVSPGVTAAITAAFTRMSTCIGGGSCAP